MTAKKNNTYYFRKLKLKKKLVPTFGRQDIQEKRIIITIKMIIVLKFFFCKLALHKSNTNKIIVLIIWQT